MFSKKDPKEKAKTLELEGDRLFAKESYKKALKKYQASQELNPDRAEIYGKLHECLEHTSAEWSEEEFEKSMEWTLKQQNLENPLSELALVRLSPEYEAFLQDAKSLLLLKDEALEQKQFKLYQGGATASLALSDFLISLKKAMDESTQEDPNHSPQE